MKEMLTLQTKRKNRRSTDTLACGQPSLIEGRREVKRRDLFKHTGRKRPFLLRPVKGELERQGTRTRPIAESALSRRGRRGLR